jgi:drug/metabolite transporter (DMT)-like permease
MLQESNHSQKKKGSVKPGKYLLQFSPHHLANKGTRVKALFALALVSFLWGTTWVASKEAVRFIHPLQLVGLRQLIAGICYLVFFMFRAARWPRGKEWITILVLSLLNFLLSNALSTWGVKYISAGLGAIIGAIFPLWLVIMAMAGSHTKIPKGTVWGIVLGFSGICVIFFEHLHDFLDPQFRIGILLLVSSTWSWAFGTVYTKKHAVNFNPYFSLGLQMVISGIALNIISGAIGVSAPLAELPWQAWAGLFYLIVFGSIISFVAYLYALQNLPTEQASLYAYFNPIVAVFLGWLIFGEKLTLFILVGAVITLYGVYLVNRSAARIR